MVRLAGPRVLWFRCLSVCVRASMRHNPKVEIEVAVNTKQSPQKVFRYTDTPCTHMAARHIMHGPLTSDAEALRFFAEVKRSVAHTFDSLLILRLRFSCPPPAPSSATHDWSNRSGGRVDGCMERSAIASGGSGSAVFIGPMLASVAGLTLSLSANTRHTRGHRQTDSPEQEAKRKMEGQPPEQQQQPAPIDEQQQQQQPTPVAAAGAEGENGGGGGGGKGMVAAPTAAAAAEEEVGEEEMDDNALLAESRVSEQEVVRVLVCVV